MRSHAIQSPGKQDFEKLIFGHEYIIYGGITLLEILFWFPLT